ncbi:MAG TPA: kelch repeat-containing protein, partial [Ktedonobacteraceae bacterium]|nr:kelch repeat-containing protein [Ktedonobacteraceae bacterium]
MANWLEDLTKTVSDDKLTRRQVVRRMGGVVAGATLAAWLPEQVLARPVAIPHASRGTWSLTGSMSAAHEYHTATLLTNGKVLVAGGLDYGYLASAELYDPKTGTWSP